MPYGWIAQHAAQPHVRAYPDGRIPGPLCIQDVPGSLGRTMQHSLLWKQPGHRWPYLEEWDLDWAATDPDGYLAKHAPKWLATPAESTLHADDLDPRRC